MYRLCSPSPCSIALECMTITTKPPSEPPSPLEIGLAVFVRFSIYTSYIPVDVTLIVRPICFSPFVCSFILFRSLLYLLVISFYEVS